MTSGGVDDVGAQGEQAQPGEVADERLTRDQEVGHYIDMWKQAVGVQMHFNDIEWRIRGLALTVATFALGAAGVAAREGEQIGPLSLGALVIVLGLLLWYAFYFVDRAWYHPLLKASVAHGTRLEDEIGKTLPQAGMTATITAGSKYEPSPLVRVLSRQPEMHSDQKLVWFYSVGAVALAVAALAFQAGVMLGPRSEPGVAPSPSRTSQTGGSSNSSPSATSSSPPAQPGSTR